MVLWKEDARIPKRELEVIKNSTDKRCSSDGRAGKPKAAHFITKRAQKPNAPEEYSNINHRPKKSIRGYSRKYRIDGLPGS